MYQNKSTPIDAFLNDNSIRLPRFQRKQTWKPINNFRLAISLFKSYPLGVTIVNNQSFKGQTTKWLLDGRQRRNALKKISENPENLYDWAKKFFTIKNEYDELDISDKFWKAILIYLNDSDEEGFKEARQKAKDNNEDEFVFDGVVYNVTNDKQDEVYTGDFSDQDDQDDTDINQAVDQYKKSIEGNLEDLLFIIKTVHKKTAKSSGFSKPFDFSKIIPTLPYIDPNKNICGKKLTFFIQTYFSKISTFDSTSNIFLLKVYALIIPNYLI